MTALDELVWLQNFINDTFTEIYKSPYSNSLYNQVVD
jgi:hypothetical protein